MWIGHGFRTISSSHREVGEFLGMDYNRNVHSLLLVEPEFYHLDTCFQKLPTESNDAIFYPQAFKDESLSQFSQFFNLIPVSEGDANKLACNAVVVQDTVILPSDGIEVSNKISDLGAKVVVAEVSEFIKSGGACQCLVIALN